MAAPRVKRRPGTDWRAIVPRVATAARIPRPERREGQPEGARPQSRPPRGSGGRPDDRRGPRPDKRFDSRRENSPERREKQPDPDSPFAKLLALKAQLEDEKK